jgi:hypothetical protein
MIPRHIHVTQTEEIPPSIIYWVINLTIIWNLNRHLHTKYITTITYIQTYLLLLILLTHKHSHTPHSKPNHPTTLPNLSLPTRPHLLTTRLHLKTPQQTIVKRMKNIDGYKVNVLLNTIRAQYSGRRTPQQTHLQQRLTMYLTSIMKTMTYVQRKLKNSLLNKQR